MIERAPSPEIRSPFHLVKCFGQLAVMGFQAAVWRVNEAIEGAIADDDEEDACIHSERWAS